MTTSSLFSRVAVLEKSLTTGGEENKTEVLPKLAELKTRIQSFEETYESRLADVQERNRQALENLAKLQDRVARRATAKAESEARAEAAKEAQAKVEEARAEEPKPKKDKAKSRRKAPVALPRSSYPDMQVLLQTPAFPEVTVADMQVMMQAVGLPTQEYCYYQPQPVPQAPILPQRCATDVEESPFVPFPTPECWDDAAPGSLLIRPLLAA